MIYLGNIIGTAAISNAAASAGGGIASRDSSFVTIEYNEIAENSADSGGGVHAFNTDVLAVRENVISDNAATGNLGTGGGVQLLESSFLLCRNVIERNLARRGCGIYAFLVDFGGDVSFLELEFLWQGQRLVVIESSGVLGPLFDVGQWITGTCVAVVDGDGDVEISVVATYGTLTSGTCWITSSTFYQGAV